MANTDPNITDPNAWTWATAAAFLWGNKEWILSKLRELRSWFRSGKGTERNPGILILGPGGVGKSTLARMLSEDYNPLFNLPGEYKESVDVETYCINGTNVEVVVPPGQEQRREATWADLHGDLASGKFRGVLFLTGYGHSCFMLSYKQHKFYAGNKEEFVEKFCEAERTEELTILRELVPHMMTSRGKLWLLTLVTKQDLWWPRHIDVEKHYLEGDYNIEIKKIYDRRGKQHFRHETAFASLVISNYLTGSNELLKPNVAGYDQKLQIESLRRLFETVDALRNWEERLMSSPEPQQELEPNIAAIGLLPLMKEYTDKLRAFKTAVGDMQKRAMANKLPQNHPHMQGLQGEFNAMQFGFNRLATPITQMIQYTSQLVQHGKLNPITRLELSLRLAELEGAMHEGRMIQVNFQNLIP